MSRDDPSPPTVQAVQTVSQGAGPVDSGIDVDDEKSTVALEHPVYFPRHWLLAAGDSTLSPRAARATSKELSA